jgi:hypothetical protein
MSSTLVQTGAPHRPRSAGLAEGHRMLQFAQWALESLPDDELRRALLSIPRG